jgi:hypothetical protein
MRNQTIKKAGRKNQRRTRRIRGGTVAEEPLFTTNLQEIFNVKIPDGEQHLKYITSLEQKAATLLGTMLTNVSSLFNTDLVTIIGLLKSFRDEYKSFKNKYERLKVNEFIKYDDAVNSFKNIKDVSSTLLSINDKYLKKIYNGYKLHSMFKSLYFSQNSHFTNNSTILTSKKSLCIIIKPVINDKSKSEEFIEKYSYLTSLISSSNSQLGGNPLKRFFARAVEGQMANLQSDIANLVGDISKEQTNINNYIMTTEKYIKNIIMDLFYSIYIINYFELFYMKVNQFKGENNSLFIISVVENFNNNYLQFIRNLFNNYKNIFQHLTKKLNKHTGKINITRTLTRTIRNNSVTNEGPEKGTTVQMETTVPVETTVVLPESASENNQPLRSGLTPTTRTVLRPASE